MKRFCLFSVLCLLASAICSCGTIASVAAPLAVAAATKNASILASGAGAAVASKTMSASMSPNGATFQNKDVMANTGPGGTQASFNNGNVFAGANITSAGGSQNLAASKNIMSIEFMANDSTGWQALQNYRINGWNIINYEVTSYGAVRLALFKQRQ